MRYSKYIIVVVCLLVLSNTLFAQSSIQEESCCQNYRGNINNSIDDEIDISDLIYLVAFMFQDGTPPSCMDEADVNASGGDPAVDISDLIYLVGYMFGDGDTPLECSATSFRDEFEGPAGQLPDLSKWGFDLGTNWGNNQLEYDTDLPSNVSLDGNGNLAIVARKENYMGQPYTSARIVTRDLFEFNYGRVEARIKLPYGQGIWPAFWLLGTDIGDVGWSQCGEIDIMEFLGHETNKAYGTLHGPGYAGGGGIGESYILESGSFDEDFHVFAIEWDANEIRWFIDDSNYFTLTVDDLGGNEWVFDHPFYIILNVAVGGAWPGYPDASTVFPQTMLIDYVRVYDSDSSIISQPNVPTVAAPTPTVDPSDVVSLYSNVYSNETISTWSTDWDVADVSNFVIGSDNVKKYSNLSYAGIEFSTPTIDVSSMTHFHIDVWTPDATDAPAVFKIKLVDFGPNGVWDENGDDVDHEIILNDNIMASESWVSIDLPLSSFTNLITKEHMALLLISGDLSTVYLDNIYFYDDGLIPDPTVPANSAPTPTVDPADVISLYSDAYTDVTIDTWSASWDNADISDFMVVSDNIKKYTNLIFAGIEFTSSTIDATAMTHFHMDVWTPDVTDAPSLFKIKLVDFGANGVWDGGGDDVEHEIFLDNTTMSTGSWVSIDIPLADFSNLITRGHLAQLIISGDPNTIFIDNIYLHKIVWNLQNYGW